jgi:Rrf2 family protein
MAHITTSVEYGLHSLFWMIGSETTPLSIRELAELQVLSPTFLAKIFPKLEKAGIVRASEGVRGGYVLARSPEEITFLEVVDAIEGEKPLFDCQNIRSQCPLYGDKPPGWVMKGVCEVHAVMLRAEKAMRDALQSQSLADALRVFERRNPPPEFTAAVQKWMGDKIAARTRKPAKRKRMQEPKRKRGRPS